MDDVLDDDALDPDAFDVVLTNLCNRLRNPRRRNEQAVHQIPIVTID